MMQVQYTYMKCKNIFKMQWQPSRHLKDAFARVLALLRSGTCTLPTKWVMTFSLMESVLGNSIYPTYLSTTVSLSKKWS